MQNLLIKSGYKQMMPSGALIAIGIVGFLGTWGFLLSAATPGGTTSVAGAYIGAGIFGSITMACAAGVIYNIRKSRYNRKHKIYKGRTLVSPSKNEKQHSEDWRSQLAGFDLGRLSLAGWILSLLSLIVFLIIAGIGASYLESNGIKQASERQMKVFAIVGMGVAAAFFLLGKWILEQCNISIVKKNRSRF
jgi:hypothetical protein